MPKKPPVGYGFKKGQVANPKGSSARARELAAIKRLSTQQVAEVGTLLLEDNRLGLKKLATSDDKSFLQVWTAALMLKGYTTGNPAIYNAVLDRIIGKPKEFKELTGPDGGPIDVRASEETDEEKVQRAEKLRQLRLSLSEDT